MADFVGEKRKQEPRKLLGVTARRQGSSQREEHPVAMLRKVARELATGVSSLNRALGGPNKLTERHTHQATHQTNQLSSVLKEIQAGFSYKSTVMERLTGQTPLALQPQSTRVVTPRISAMRARPVRTHRAGSIAQGADREARHHLDSPATGRAAELPSAARLAQILHADRLMVAGEVKPHAQVQRWAGAIRAGQRRSIADLSPERVQTVLHEAMGGSDAAQRLNTPEVHQLIDRHHSTLQTIQTGLRETEKIVELARSHPRGRANRGTRVEPTRMSPAASARDYTGLVAPSAPSDHRQDTSRLAEMLATNEEPHLYAEDSDRRQIMQQSAQEGVASTSGASKGVDRPMGASESKNRSTGSGITAMSRREVPSAISAPPQRAITNSSEVTEPNKGRKKDRMELSGTMTLVSRGQTIGDMRVNAELR